MDINQPFRRWRRISQRPPLSIFSLQDFLIFLFDFFLNVKEREREREKQWLVLLSCSLRVHLVHSDHVFQTREKFVGQDSSLSVYSNIPLFLPSFYTHIYFHFLIIHLLLGLGLCVRATLAFRTHWSRGHQGHELSFSFFFRFILIILFCFLSFDRSIVFFFFFFFFIRCISPQGWFGNTDDEKMWFRSSWANLK